MLERYMVAREIGLGPLATTQLAVQHGDAGLRRLVLAKVLHSAVRAEHLFRRCRALATLEHHNLARVVDQGVDRARPLVIYDYVVGESLLSLLGRCVRLRQAPPTHLAARIIADACAGLHAGHGACSPDGARCTVLHGAVRPSNVMLSYDGCTKVVDFGIEDVERLAREHDFTAAQAQFSAPELLRGQPVAGRADAYAAAVLLYTLLTLRYPYDEHGSGAAVLQAKLQRRPVPPAARSAAVPVALERLLLQALAPDPRDRPPSAEALQRELERFVAQQAQPASAAALAAYLQQLFGSRIAAKQAALRALLSMPPGAMLAGDTTVEVVAPALDDRAYSDIFVRPADATTDVEVLPFADEPGAFDSAATAPAVEPHRALRPAASGPGEETDPRLAPDAYPTQEVQAQQPELYEEDEDTAVRRSR